jgi:N-acetylglucosaminyl-diphospho-decaprenol L-rhamnosyltransferase
MYFRVDIPVCFKEEEERMNDFFSIIVVTYNSEKFLATNLQFLKNQDYKKFELIIVDSGSKNKDYLKELTSKSDLDIKLILSDENLGFAKANNLGILNCSEKSDYTVFLNPDAFLPSNFLEDAQVLLHNGVSVLTGKLLRYDIDEKQATSIIDSAAIFRDLIGRWYDRGQGQKDKLAFNSPNLESVPAICGALLICNNSVIKDVINRREQFFDESFFMYKEDIELSRYLITLGYQLNYSSSLIAFHCRGWQNRKSMSKMAKEFSAKNDLTLASRYSKRSIPFALAKLLYVRFWELRE